MPSYQRPEFDRPASDRPVADVDPPLRQQFLDIAIPEAELELQPHGMTDHICREPVALERNRLHERCFPPAACTYFARDLLSCA